MDREEVIGQNQGIANQSENVTSIPLSSPALTFDVIIEILTWLPVMALLRFKTVCKEWKAIIESYNFIFKHYNRSLPCVVTDHQSEDGGYRYDCLGLYYGMIVERGRALLRRQKYRIRNPATRRVIELSDPHEFAYGMFLYRLSSPGDFKLISLYDNGVEAGNGCQILSLDGSDNTSWRPLSVPDLHEPGERMLNSKFVLIGKVVHCVIKSSNASKPCWHVLSLDMEKECFISIITPVYCLADLNEVQPFQYNGQVTFSELAEEGLQVYTLEAHDNKLVKKVVLPLLFFENNPLMMEIFAVRGSEVWLNWDGSKLFIYDTILRRITFLKPITHKERYGLCRRGPAKVIIKYAFPLMPSLFGIKRMGPTQRMTPNQFTQLPRV